MKDRRPDIYEYHDYRTFLREWTQWLKSRRQGYSLRALAREAGLSCAYLPQVLSGKRKLTQKALAKVMGALKLPSRERHYLELLVQAAEGSATERAEAMEQTQRLRAYRKANPKESEVYRYLTRWFYVALKELASVPGFQADPSWILSRIRGGLNHQQVADAVTFLTENGFLRTDPNGTIRPAEKDIRCVGEVFRAALRQFHHQMMGISLQSLDESPAGSHIILGHTTAISSKQFGRVREILQNALRQIERLGQEEKGLDAVYHIGLLAAPLTK